MDPLKFVLVCIGGWMNREQQKEIEYLRAENRVLRTKVPGKRVRFTQAQRNLLATKAKGIRFSRLNVTSRIEIVKSDVIVIVGKK